MMTVSALHKLMPTPPARVVKRYMNISEFGLLNSSMSFWRSACFVFPSCLQLYISIQVKKKHNILVVGT